MSTTTPINGFTIPQLADVANIETAFNTFASAVDSRCIPRFTTTAARDAAITSPVNGQMATVSGTGEIYLHNGTAWVSAVPRIFYKAADQGIQSDTGLSNDDTMVAPVEINSVYKYTLSIALASPAAAGFKFSFTIPAGATGNNLLVTGFEAGGTGAIWGQDLITDIPVLATESGHPGDNDGLILAGCIVTAGTAGNLAWLWAQNTSQAQTTNVLKNSWMEIWKIA